MSNFEIFKDFLLKVFTKEVCIGLVLFMLFLLFMSLVTGGDDDSGSPKGNDEKKFTAPKDGGEYPM
ncbi:MAG: hypothetical protein KBD52_01545 [Candidatus Pacebacteria bacterium]|nr:hypothetical protein [Candidatus Paceibacterota bacterium]